VVSARFPSDLLGRLDQARGETPRGTWLVAVASAELDGTGRPALAAAAAPAPVASPAATAGPRSLGPAIPAPGAACSWPACWNRDSDRYGVTDPAALAARPSDPEACGIVLCKAHAARLQGQEYRRQLREVPPAWRSRGSARSATVPADRPA
jgi:hypothetical protein